jgi:hypothetical protein
LNVTLLTSHILSAPAIWHAPDGLQTPLGVLGVFRSASLHVLQYERNPAQSGIYAERRGLPKEEWVKAVARGVDDRSPRWKHLLVLAGTLAGFESNGQLGLPPALRRTLEAAVVKAANMALRDPGSTNELARGAICLALGRTHDLLSHFEKGQIDYESLLPIMVQEIFFSREGLHRGYFLSKMDNDVIQAGGNKFRWSSRSPTYYQIQRMAVGPLVSALGSLSDLMGFGVESVLDTGVLLGLSEDLSTFARSLCVQWRQNKLSEIDISEEAEFLDEETRKSTIPLLWQVLKAAMFAVVIVQRSLLGCVLAGGRMPTAEGR